MSRKRQSREDAQKGPETRGRKVKTLADDVLILLGTKPDIEIALALGVTAKTVRRWRMRRGIAAPRAPGRPLRSVQLEVAWGEMSDRQIARNNPVARNTIAKWRTGLNIPPYERGNRHPRTQVTSMGGVGT